MFKLGLWIIGCNWTSRNLFGSTHIVKEITDIVVDNAKLQVATTQKHLGLMSDSTLSWSDQVSHTYQKMAYYLYLINHHRHVLPPYLIAMTSKLCSATYESGVMILQTIIVSLKLPSSFI